MIKNIIFDIGNVLAPFSWRSTYEQLFKGDELERMAELTVLDGEAWNKLDKGELSFEEILQIFIKKAPELEEKIRTAVDKIYCDIKPYPYAADLVKNLKERGYGVYALSNYGQVPFEKSLPRFSFMDYMDGAVISYQIKEIKPQAEIFNYLLKKYNLKAFECLFLDDNENNIRAASALGFETVLFGSIEDAKREYPNIFI